MALPSSFPFLQAAPHGDRPFKDLIDTGLALNDHALVRLDHSSRRPVTRSLFHQTSVSSADVFSAIQAVVQRRAGIGPAGRNIKVPARTVI